MHLSNDFDIEYGSDEEMAKACQDKNFDKNFKLLAAQEIVKFNANLEEPSSQVQNYPTFENAQLMISLDSNKGKEPFYCLNTIIPPNIDIP